MVDIHLNGLLVEPIIERVRDWNQRGKITEDDLDRALSTEARALVEYAIGKEDWARLQDVEEVLTLVGEQIGDETDVVDWADAIVGAWRQDRRVDDLVRAGRSLTDPPGFVVSQLSEALIRGGWWCYEGGRAGFSVRLERLAGASPILKTLLGAALARMANAATGQAYDTRFTGVDDDDLVVFGEVEREDRETSESRLHRAALVA